MYNMYECTSIDLHIKLIKKCIIQNPKFAGHAIKHILRALWYVKIPILKNKNAISTPHHQILYIRLCRVTTSEKIRSNYIVHNLKL